MKKYELLFIIFIPLFLFAREHIAIIEFENIDVSENEAKVLTQKLTTEMKIIGKYIVLERSEMK